MLVNQTIILAHQYNEQVAVAVVLMTLTLPELLVLVVLVVADEAERITNFRTMEQSTRVVVVVRLALLPQAILTAMARPVDQV